MNPEQLLQHFDRISEAPDAVARLRRFVLDLAVRGKLVEQDPDDEPASELLKRIQAEKDRITPRRQGAKKGKDGSLGELASWREGPFVIPESWAWSKLAEIGFISPRNDIEGVTPVSFVPMTLIPAEYGIPHKHEIRTWGEIKTGYTHFAEGDVGLAKITPCFENGKSTVFRNLTSGYGAGTTELHIVRPLLIDADYVLLFLKCPHFVASGIPRMTGTAGQKRVPADYFSYSPFPLPPLAEQHRIVAKIDELMGLCDQLEAAKKEREARRDWLVGASLHRIGNVAQSSTSSGRTGQAEGDESVQAESVEALAAAARFHLNHLPRLTTRPEHIKQLRQTILNLAVRGRLVPQDPNDEPVNLSASPDELKAGALPKNWRYEPLANLLAEDTRNGYSRRPDEAPDGTPILRISAGTVRRDGVVAEEEHKLISGIDPATRAQYGLKPGDLLACRFNGNKAFVGRLTIFSDYLGIQPIYPDKLIRVRAAPDVSVPAFLRLAGDTDQVRKSIEAACATTVGNWGISASKLKDIRFPVPPLPEQHRIVAKVDQLMALCDQLEIQLTTTQTDSRRLLEAVLRDALEATPALAN